MDSTLQPGKWIKMQLEGIMGTRCFDESPERDVLLSASDQQGATHRDGGDGWVLLGCLSTSSHLSYLFPKEHRDVIEARPPDTAFLFNS